MNQWNKRPDGVYEASLYTGDTGIVCSSFKSVRYENHENLPGDDYFGDVDSNFLFFNDDDLTTLVSAYFLKGNFKTGFSGVTKEIFRDYARLKEYFVSSFEKGRHPTFKQDLTKLINARSLPLGHKRILRSLIKK